MKKKTIAMPVYLTPEQKKYVQRTAQKLCVTQAEVIRRALDRDARADNE